MWREEMAAIVAAGGDVLAAAQMRTAFSSNSMPVDNSMEADAAQCAPLLIVGAPMVVVVWLRSLGLGKYEAIFRENDIDDEFPKFGFPALGGKDRTITVSEEELEKAASPWRALASQLAKNPKAEAKLANREHAVAQRAAVSPAVPARPPHRFFEEKEVTLINFVGNGQGKCSRRWSPV